MITNDPSVAEAQRQKLADAAEKVDAAEKKLRKIIESEKGIALLDGIHQTRVELYYPARDMLFYYIESGDKENAESMLFGDFQQAQNAYVGAVFELINYQNELVDLSADDALKAYESGRNMQIIFAVITIIVGIVLTIWIVGSITKPLNKAVEAADRIANGDLDVDLQTNARDETGVLLESMKKMSDNISQLIKETNILADAGTGGRLDVRADPEKYSGEYKNLIKGFNNTLDAVIGPLNVSAEYIDRISKGDIPEKIRDDYSGDFNEIKNNMNALIDSLLTIIDDTIKLSSETAKGKLRTRADESRHNGEFRRIIGEINSAFDSIVYFVDDLPIPVMAIDSNFNIVYMNNLGSKLDRNKTPKLVEGKKCFDHFKTGDCKTKNCACNIAMDTKKTALRETDAHPGEHDLEIKYSALPILDAKGNVQGAFEVVIDETQIKESMRVSDIIKQYQENESQRLTEALSQLAEGDLNFQYVPADAKEEAKESRAVFVKIGDALCSSKAAIEALISDANQLVRNAYEGKLDARADAEKHKGEFRTIVEGINKTLDSVLNPINEAVDVLKKMSAGNLSVKIKGDYRGDHATIKEALNQTIDLMPFKDAIDALEKIADGDLRELMEGDYKGDSLKLKQSLNETIESMNMILSQVKNTVEEVTNGAHQVSDASSALSQGATEQAASLEEITSSMMQISSATKQNAEKANIASELTRSARSAAEKGADEMSLLTKAMTDIDSSSKDISKIIKVIDEIAFQTNLLALNAAVEAARAGRHGKGFAVVAEEVRNLAARSATAAKETSEMIENSMKNAQQGSELAGKTANALDEIRNIAGKSADLVNEIAVSSNEQAEGISQINEGLSQIDKVTQTNTSSAEESSSAAEELSSQANDLKRLIAKFKLNDKYVRSEYGDDYAAPELQSRRGRALPEHESDEDDEE